MAVVNIRIDDNIKKRGDALFKELGLNFSSAVNIFVKQSLVRGEIPFKLTTKIDPFYSSINLEQIDKVINDFEKKENIFEHELLEESN